MINKIFRFLPLLTLFMVALSSCSDDDDESYYTYGTVSLDKTGLFVESGSADRSKTTEFSITNVASLEIDEVLDGWSVEMNFYKGVITVTAPDEADIIYDIDDDNYNATGDITFSGTTFEGAGVYATLFVGVVDFVYIDRDLDMQANSMIVTSPRTLYVFNPTYKGEDKSQTINGVEYFELLWRDYPSSFRHVQLLSPTEGAFYIAHDRYDVDEDGVYSDFLSGNAVIVVRDASGDILWNWHIWALESGYPSEVAFNGEIFMDRNLGATLNSIGEEASATKADADSIILASYGLYYQWGRKDPYVKPIFYDAAGGYNSVVVNADVSSIPVNYREITSYKGTMSYTRKAPMNFIVINTSDDTPTDPSDGDWLYKNHNGLLWNDAEKSIYDPSPKGWRVPKSTAFDGVTVSNIPASCNSSDYTYGGYLKDIYGVEELFMGLGRRSYLKGSVENVNTNTSNLAPWTGYYWTSTASTGTEIRSNCLKFASDYTIDGSFPSRRANGMQIRCVKY